MAHRDNACRTTSCNGKGISLASSRGLHATVCLSIFEPASCGVQFLTTALRSGSINAGTLLRGESLTNENWLQEAEFK